MYSTVRGELQTTLDEIRAAGLYKTERQLASPQSAHVTAAGRGVLNFCANNYLGFADDPRLVSAAKAALDEWGFGMASVRFICGTQTQHVALERKISDFLRTEATILFPSCFDANGGVFEVLLGWTWGITTGVVAAAMLVVLWLVVPLSARAHAPDGRPPRS